MSSSGLSFGLVFLGNLGRILGVELIVNGLATGLLSIGGGVGVGLLDARRGIRVYEVTAVVRSATVRILTLACHATHTDPSAFALGPLPRTSSSVPW